MVFIGGMRPPCLGLYAEEGATPLRLTASLDELEWVWGRGMSITGLLFLYFLLFLLYIVWGHILDLCRDNIYCNRRVINTIDLNLY